MRTKLFISLFFPKRQLMVGYLLSMVVFLLFIGFRIGDIERQFVRVFSFPDYVITAGSESGFSSGVSPRTTDNALKLELEELFGGRADIQEIGVSPGYSASQKDTIFQVFVAQEEFFANHLARFLTGRPPNKEMTEMVIGNALSEKLGLKTNDTLEIILPGGNEKYVITGVVRNGADFFTDKALILHSSNDNNRPPEDVLLLYLNGAKLDEITESDFSKIVGKYQVGSQERLDGAKKNGKRDLLIEISAIVIVGVIGVLLLTANLIKGNTAKIGLLKSQGISDICLKRTCLGGLSIFVTTALLLALGPMFIFNYSYNARLSLALGYKANSLRVTPVVGVGLITYSMLLLIIMYLFLLFRTTRISPREAMLKV